MDCVEGCMAKRDRKQEKEEWKMSQRQTKKEKLTTTEREKVRVRVIDRVVAFFSVDAAVFVLGVCGGESACALISELFSWSFAGRFRVGRGYEQDHRKHLNHSPIFVVSFLQC